jgi:hypothetical protein
LKLKLYEQGLDALVREKEAAKIAHEKWKTETEKQPNNEPTSSETEDPSQEGVTNETKVSTENPKTKDQAYVETDPKEDIVSEFLQLSASECIQTRVLYYVAPKKSKRRGEKPGVAYLILTPPPFEMLPTVLELSSSSKSNLSAVVASKKSMVLLQNTPPPVDYAREIAKRKIVLQNALQALQAVAATDALHNANALSVEEAMNPKIWKPIVKTKRNPLDRLMGTIFDTPDYQEFMTKTARLKQERNARPRPAPGGGGATVLTTGLSSSAAAPSSASTSHGVTSPTSAVATATSSTMTNNKDTPEVAKLVEFIISKRLDEKNRKAARRKTQDTKKKKSDGGTSKTTTVVNTTGSCSATPTKTKKRGKKHKRMRKPKAEKIKSATTSIG